MAKLPEFDTRDFMSGYGLVITVKHTRQMRIRFWLAQKVMVIAAWLLKVADFELVEREPDL